MQTFIKAIHKYLLIVLLLFCTEQLAHAQKTKNEAPELTRIEFLFDASQSMYGKWQTGAKIDVAKKLMSQLMDSLRYVRNIELALRVYGHQKPFPPQDCDDSKLEVPFSKGNIPVIMDVLKNIVPRGTTPIARSLEACANDFPASKSRNIIILITDGIEECGGDPCAISQALQRKGIFLKPFVIGLGLDESLKKTFECVGRYFDAANETMFKDALNIVISQALNNTTLQVNLLDVDHNPTETNVAMTFYDRFSGEDKYNFIHTLNSKGNPDTLVIDPLPVYKIVVHTIPEVSKDSIILVPGKHTTIGIDAPQGDLMLKFDGPAEYKKVSAIIRQRKQMNTLNVQDIGNTERYLVGTYDLEILTVPRILLENVDVSQSKTTTVSIPRPGIVTLIANNGGYGSIYVYDGKNMKWILNLNDDQPKQTFILQPGKYKAVFRPKNSRESIYTIEREFSVVSGESSIVLLNP
ncbi:MAG: VWA domain-containing protein [Bacteroidia bacterium]